MRRNVYHCPGGNKEGKIVMFHSFEIFSGSGTQDKNNLALLVQ